MAPADAALAAAYPGDSGARQPVHTVYVPADRVAAGLAPTYGRAARDALDRHAPDPEALASVVGADPARVAEAGRCSSPSSTREPVEDLRIDLEDGYRGHAAAEEDGHAVAAVRALAGGDGAAVLGGAVQVLRGRHPGPRAAHPRPGARRGPRVRTRCPPASGSRCRR